MALGVIALATTLFVIFGTKSTSSNRNLGAPLTTAATVTPSEDWKTFDGAEGYSFQYPPETVVESDAKSPPTVTITVGESTFALVVNSTVRTKVSSPQCYLERARRSINGTVWSVNNLQCGTGGNSVTVYSVVSGANVFEVSYPGSENSESLEQILSTFRFGA
jgi:hypothetical protein